MIIDGTGQHLSYCTNIHAGETWSEVRQNLAEHLPAVMSYLAQANPRAEAAMGRNGFGVGLRLSGTASDALQDANALSEFENFLKENNCYVFTINGFPYGAFHGTRVKEDVYLPDWRDAERARYSKQLAQILARLLPEDCDGSISTVPVAFKTAVTDAADITRAARGMIDVVAELVQIEREQGKSITLAIEPEPCCYLETIEETIEYFNRYLFSTDGCDYLAQRLSVMSGEAECHLRKHLSVCLDLCHSAVEFEEPVDSVQRLREAGIQIGKLQVSSGLRMRQVTPERSTLLREFDDKVYLHQVVEHHAGSVARFPDLDEAFASLGDDAVRDEWRVHCHVPLFVEEFNGFSSTQDYVVETLRHHLDNPISTHIEVETYTWSVLPDRYRGEDMDAAIARELDWTLKQL